MNAPEKSFLVNRLINVNNYKSYLELGTNDAFSPKSMFYHIQCENKFGVDRLFKTDYTGDAQDFLNQNDKKFDCIYIDCDYSFEGSYQLAFQSKDALNKGGVILMNFADPLSKEWQTEKPGNNWIGQVWKTVVKLHHSSDQSFDAVIIKNTGNSDGRPQSVLPLDEAEGMTHGLAVLRVFPKNSKNKEEKKKDQVNKFDDKLLDYSFYEKNKSDIMNIVSVKDFFSEYCTYEQHLESSRQFWSKK